MALTAYCKKCGREVDPGEVCPYCGTRLGKAAAHSAWVVQRLPVRNWMCWNAVMRLLLPAVLAVLILTMLPELLSGGWAGLERLFAGAFPVTLLILFAALLLAVLLILALQGRDLVDHVVDSRGIHLTCYLTDPTPLRLLCRGKRPSLMKTAAGDPPVVLLWKRDLAWKDVARVQLWPEKCMVLFYAPSWWMRASVSCTPFVWEDVLSFVREKLGKKKKVGLPASLRAAAVTTPARRRQAPSYPKETPLSAVPEEPPFLSEAGDTGPGGDPVSPDE